MDGLPKRSLLPGEGGENGSWPSNNRRPVTPGAFIYAFGLCSAIKLELGHGFFHSPLPPVYLIGQTCKSHQHVVLDALQFRRSRHGQRNASLAEL